MCAKQENAAARVAGTGSRPGHCLDPFCSCNYPGRHKKKGRVCETREQAPPISGEALIMILAMAENAETP